MACWALLLGVGSGVITICTSLIGRESGEEVYVGLRGVEVVAQSFIHIIIAYINSLDCSSLVLHPLLPYALAFRWALFGLCQNQWREWGRWVDKPAFKALKRIKENEGLTALAVLLSLMVCYHKNALTSTNSVCLISVAISLPWPLIQVIIVNSHARRQHCFLACPAFPFRRAAPQLPADHFISNPSAPDMASLHLPAEDLHISPDMASDMSGPSSDSRTSRHFNEADHDPRSRHEAVALLVHPCLFVKVGGDLLFLVLGGVYTILFLRGLLQRSHPFSIVAQLVGLSFWLISTYPIWKQMRMLMRILWRIAQPYKAAVESRQTICEIVSDVVVHSPWLLLIRTKVLATYGVNVRKPSLPRAGKVNEALALASAFNKNAESRVCQSVIKGLGIDTQSVNLRRNLCYLSIILGGCPIWNAHLRRTSLRVTEIVAAIERSAVQLCGGVGDDAIAVSILGDENVRLHASSTLGWVDDVQDRMEAAEAISLGSTFMKKLILPARRQD